MDDQSPGWTVEIEFDPAVGYLVSKHTADEEANESGEAGEPQGQSAQSLDEAFQVARDMCESDDMSEDAAQAGYQSMQPKAPITRPGPGRAIYGE